LTAGYNWPIVVDMETTRIETGSHWQRIGAAESITIGRKKNENIVQVFPNAMGNEYYMRREVFTAKFERIA
jgi:hypothetical protein